MRTDSNTVTSVERRSPWLGIVKFLFIALLTIIIFLLGQAMVRHRFFRGGFVDQHDTLRP
jgi:ABC-type microcin C transport system permease subunit YejE